MINIANTCIKTAAAADDDDNPFFNLSFIHLVLKTRLSK